MSAVTLDWTTNRDGYEALLASAGRSNMLQCWAWGEAKAEAEGWQPRRAILACGSVAIAIAQVLEKRVGPATVARLNRGPVWLCDSLTAEVRAASLTCLHRHWRWWRGRALLAAPELTADEAGLLAGFRPRPGAHWCSAWLDLRHDPAEARKSLNGKWRNMLVNAEKAGLAVDVLCGEAGVGWLLPRYEAMMAEKGFVGVSSAMLAALARHAGTEDLLVLRARTDDEEASAVLIARHGAAATYLVGWNGEAGRKSRANHLLLWQAMNELRERGCTWLDLGGIDAQRTPGVAAFKRGLNGVEYTLAGEYLSI